MEPLCNLWLAVSRFSLRCRERVVGNQDPLSGLCRPVEDGSVFDARRQDHRSQPVAAADLAALAPVKPQEGEGGGDGVEHVFGAGAHPVQGHVDGIRACCRFQGTVCGRREHLIGCCAGAVSGFEEGKTQAHPRWGIGLQGRPLGIANAKGLDHQFAVPAAFTLAWLPASTRELPRPEGRQGHPGRPLL